MKMVEEMVEVFKTNVETGEQAERLTQLIHESFPQYTANFDLTDCDRILRFQSSIGIIPTDQVIRFMHKAGFQAEILPDDVPPYTVNSILMVITED